MKSKIIENVSVVDIADKGKAIGKREDQVFLIDQAVPGDVVDLEVRRKRKSMWEGRVLQTKSYSTDRVEPFCSHFENCGGCKWQHLSYEAQLSYKQKKVSDVMKRLAGLDNANVLEILPAPATRFYRNKLEYSFSNRRWLSKEEIGDSDIIAGNALGFHAPGRYDKVIDIRECFLQDDLSNKIRNFIRDHAEKNHLSYYDFKAQSGFLRNIIVRNNTKDEWMVIVVFNEDKKESIEQLMHSLNVEFPQIQSLQYVINGKANDTIYDLPVMLFAGEDHIRETLEDIQYRIGPKSFFQTNSMQALAMYRIVRDWAELEGDENVYDLYTGTGSIALFLARHCKKVVGVDSVPEAIEHAKVNAEINSIDNTEFFSGDMKTMFDDSFAKLHGIPDLIITDPPRAGMHEKVVDQILSCEAPQVIYISCNPATQARDLKILSSKYRIEKIQPLDMFPHTDHVENIVSLKL